MEPIHGLVGRRLAHSWSPELHALLGDPDYRLFEVEPEALAAFFARADFAGVNVTIPYKRDAALLCGALSPEAARVGAVNTVVRRGGQLVGYNTDVPGFEWLLRRAGVSLTGRRVVVLGNGGASRTVRYVAEKAAAREITVVSRTGPDHYGNLDRHADADVVVNATPVGMYPGNLAAPVSLAAFPRCRAVVDLIYNPRRTALMQEARALGIPCAGGLAMLAAQAAYTRAIFAGADDAAPDPALDMRIADAVRTLARARENVILIGMPGCGKTTVGRALAALMGRAFVDTDAEVERAAGRSVAAIFASDGEAAFRRLEHEAVLRAGARLGIVLVTGGGVVLDPANEAALRQNGRVCHIERALPLLATGGRPLSRPDALAQMYARRLPLYERFRDTVIVNDGTPEAAAEAIRRDFDANLCD